MSTLRPGFRTVIGREGYDVHEVDTFVARLEAALGHRPPAITAEEVSAQRFTPVRLREGYDMAEVDEFLDKVAAELHRRRVESSGEEAPWELRPAYSGSPGANRHGSTQPAWVRVAALVALVALVGLVLAQIL